MYNTFTDMKLRKYKYYFRKPKSEITKDILSWLFIAGTAIVIAGISPSFITNTLLKYRKLRKYPKKRVASTFSYLRKRGLLNMEQKDRQVYISLTDEGRRKAGMFQINSLGIRRPNKWDGKWRFLFFDITEKRRPYREALRGMLKQLHFYPFQKSVWVHAFDCRAEVELLRDFFDLSEDELRFITAQDIGNVNKLKRFFHLV